MVLFGRCAVAISFSTSLLDLYISGASGWWCCRCCDCLSIIIISSSSSSRGGNSDSSLRSSLARSQKRTSLIARTSYSQFCQKLPDYATCSTSFCVTIYRAERSCGCYYFCRLQHRQNCYIDSNSAVLIDRQRVYSCPPSPNQRLMHRCSYTKLHCLTPSVNHRNTQRHNRETTAI